MVELDDAAVLLNPEPLSLEMGIQRLPSGQLHVAARTDMYRCSGAMFEWWFRFAPDTQQYSWWHPLDHVSSGWRETNPRTHVGSTHLVEEKECRLCLAAGVVPQDAVRVERLSLVNDSAMWWLGNGVDRTSIDKTADTCSTACYSYIADATNVYPFQYLLHAWHNGYNTS